MLRGELTARLGLAWTTPVKGIAEVAGIPADLLAAFSTRRRQILDAMADAGTAGPDAAQAACLATRPAKPAAEPETTLRDRWAARTRAAGHHPSRVVGDVLGRNRAPGVPPVDQLAQLGPAGLTAQATGFDRRDLLQALCQTLPPGCPVDRAGVEAVADRVLAHRDTVRLATPTGDGARWSTTELLAVEQAAIGRARELFAVPPRPVSADTVDEAIAGRTLSAEQQHMVRALAAVAGLAVVIGPAGAGKTAALTAAVDVWTRQGRPVTGAAVAAVTARRLEHATGIRLLDQPPRAGIDGAMQRRDVEGVVMLAVRRAEVTDLNDTTRALLLAGGRLGPDAVTAGAGERAREYRAGDRVLVTANDHRRALLNGTRAAVTASTRGAGR